MELMQGALGNMDTVVKGVMLEQGDLQKWKPKVESKMKEIADTMQGIQIQVEKFEKRPMGVPVGFGDTGGGGKVEVLSSEPPMVDSAGGVNQFRRSDPNRRPGTEGG
jgi:hypothetical protein